MKLPRTDDANNRRVSTAYIGKLRPISKPVWQTMVFDLHDGESIYPEIYLERYPNEIEAAKGHVRILAAVQNGNLL